MKILDDWRVQLIWWSMWKDLPLWNIRLGIRKGFIMAGPYELRIEKYENS